MEHLQGRCRRHAVGGPRDRDYRLMLKWLARNSALPLQCFSPGMARYGGAQCRATPPREIRLTDRRQISPILEPANTNMDNETWPIWGRKFEGQIQTNFKKQAIGPGDLASDWPSKADRLWIHKAGGAHDDLIQSCPRRISCKRWSLAIRDEKWNSGRRRLSDSGVRRLGRGSRR